VHEALDPGGGVRNQEYDTQVHQSSSGVQLEGSVCGTYLSSGGVHQVARADHRYDRRVFDDVYELGSADLAWQSEAFVAARCS
jgi:hypothetical protein